MPKIIPLFCLVMVISTGAPTYGADQETRPMNSSTAWHTLAGFELGLSLEMMRGHTQYQRGGTSGNMTYRFPISELVFPLDVTMLGVQAAYRLDRFRLTGEVKKNISSASGEMEDSDWGTWYYWPDLARDVFQRDPIRAYEIDTLDIYSESDAVLDALIAQVAVEYRLIERPRWSLNATLGYRYQNFVYDVYDVNQWYPSASYYTGMPERMYDVSCQGKVLEYEITYHIPYLGAQFTGTITDRIRIKILGGYAPYVKAHDRDDHLISRTPHYSLSDYEGDAVMYGLGMEGSLTKHWNLGCAYDVLDISTEGDSDNYLSSTGAYSGTIDQNAESRQRDFRLQLTYVF